MPGLYDYPALYDALFPVGAHVDFYADLAAQQPGPVLELACGTGQLTMPVARTRPTVGIDRSFAMLSAARNVAAATSPMTTAAFGRISVEETIDYDAVTRVNHAMWYITAPDTGGAWTVPLVLRSIFPDELAELFAASGLELVERFGDVRREPFEAGSRLQVCICRRVR